MDWSNRSGDQRRTAAEHATEREEQVELGQVAWVRPVVREALVRKQRRDEERRASWIPIVAHTGSESTRRKVRDGQ